MPKYCYTNGVLRELTQEEIDAMMAGVEDTPSPEAEPVTLESLDHRLTDVEYIITGEVATNAQR